MKGTARHHWLEHTGDQAGRWSFLSATETLITPSILSREAGSEIMPPPDPSTPVQPDKLPNVLQTQWSLNEGGQLNLTHRALCKE